jgi:hypothetical protein
MEPTEEEVAEELEKMLAEGLVEMIEDPITHERWYGATDKLRNEGKEGQ